MLNPNASTGNKNNNIFITECWDDGTTFGISKEDLINLLEYYRYIKENDIQDDFINPNGANWCIQG